MKSEGTAEDIQLRLHALVCEDQTVTQLAVLQRSALFAVLDPAALSGLVSYLEAVLIEAGRVICRQGEPGDRLYLIAAGRFSVWQTPENQAETRHIRDLGPGDSFGEIALLTDQLRTATIRCEEHSRLLALDRDRFLRFLRNEPAFGAALATTLSRWLLSQEPPSSGSPATARDGAAQRLAAPEAILNLPASILSLRETEVLTLVAEGRSNQAIAEALVLSERTVEHHIANINEKIGVSGRSARAAATAYALTHNLLAAR